MNIFLNKNKTDITPEDIYLDSESQNVTYLEQKHNDPLLRVLLGLIFLILIIMWIKAFNLQIVKGTQFYNQSLARTLNSSFIKAPRGIIYDKNHQVLATNEASFDLVANMKDIPKDNKNLTTIIQHISHITQISEQDIKNKLQANGVDRVVIKENVSRDSVILFNVYGNQLIGFKIEQSSIRHYPDPTYFSHIIGYTGKLTVDEFKHTQNYLFNDIIGKNGLEYTYESQLKGIYGVQDNDSSQESSRPNPGNSVVLSIDAELQKKFYDTLQETLTKRGLKKAAGIVIDTTTGQILSMVSLPSYDNNLFSQGISSSDYAKLSNDNDKPLLNRVVGGEYAPGSTIKPLLAGAMLDEGIIKENTTINDPLGRLVVPNPYNPSQPSIFPDWKPHGVSDVKKAIAESVNTFFYTFGGGTPDHKGLGIDKIDQYYQKFGFGKKTEIDLTGERDGNVPTPDWKLRTQKQPWVLGDTYHVSIGQGDLTATPLQLIAYVASIANGGTLFKPQVASYTEDFYTKQVKQQFSPQIIKAQLLKAESLRIVQQGMLQTNTEGSGRLMKELPFKSGGKTGTSQTGGLNKNNAWFVSYAPYEKPKIAVLALIEEGEDSYGVAVPVVKDIMKWYYENRGF